MVRIIPAQGAAVEGYRSKHSCTTGFRGFWRGGRSRSPPSVSSKTAAAQATTGPQQRAAEPPTGVEISVFNIEIASAAAKKKRGRGHFFCLESGRTVDKNMVSNTDDVVRDSVSLIRLVFGKRSAGTKVTV